MKVYFVTHGCKANQYDTEKYRQELEARGARVVDSPELADACVINTCTVTNNADAAARKEIRKVKRTNPEIQVVVAGCSAALRADEYGEMDEVFGVVPGQDAVQVAEVLAPLAPFEEEDQEPIGAALLVENKMRSRGWLKIQDGCDRRCSFCATRIARGDSRSRPLEQIVAEAEILSDAHRELVLTGIHIGHYGLDLNERGSKTFTLSKLVEALVKRVPNTRFRLGSIEATEVDDQMVELLEGSGGVLVPHLHIPMQSGSDDVLRGMRRWHTREQYRTRVSEIADRLPYMGLGADIIVGFPGETDENHRETAALVSELPYTYLHVFPYSERSGTIAADLPDKVPPQVKAERSKELRDLAVEKGQAYRQERAGQQAQIVIEENGFGITEDYLRVRLDGETDSRISEIVSAPLEWDAHELVASI